MRQVLLRSVTLIIISTIDALSINDKVRFTEEAKANQIFRNINFEEHLRTAASKFCVTTSILN